MSVQLDAGDPAGAEPVRVRAIADEIETRLLRLVDSLKSD